MNNSIQFLRTLESSTHREAVATDKIALPEITNEHATRIAQYKGAVATFFVKLWMFCSFEMIPEDLPAEVLKQLQLICLQEDRDITKISLVRKSWAVFEVREKCSRTYWDLFIHHLTIN